MVAISLTGSFVAVALASAVSAAPIAAPDSEIRIEARTPTSKLAGVAVNAARTAAQSGTRRLAQQPSITSTVVKGGIRTAGRTPGFGVKTPNTIIHDITLPPKAPPGMQLGSKIQGLVSGALLVAAGSQIQNAGVDAYRKVVPEKEEKRRRGLELDEIRLERRTKAALRRLASSALKSPKSPISNLAANRGSITKPSSFADTAAAAGKPLLFSSAIVAGAEGAKLLEKNANSKSEPNLKPRVATELARGGARIVNTAVRTAGRTARTGIRPQAMPKPQTIIRVHQAPVSPELLAKNNALKKKVGTVGAATALAAGVGEGTGGFTQDYIDAHGDNYEKKQSALEAAKAAFAAEREKGKRSLDERDLGQEIELSARTVASQAAGKAATALSTVARTAGRTGGGRAAMRATRQAPPPVKVFMPQAAPAPAPQGMLKNFGSQVATKFNNMGTTGQIATLAIPGFGAGLLESTSQNLHRDGSTLELLAHPIKSIKGMTPEKRSIEDLD